MFRPNWIRPHFNGVNYEAHVGKRTHVNLFFGVEGMLAYISHMSRIHLPYISPISRLYLPYISPISRQR